MGYLRLIGVLLCVSFTAFGEGRLINGKPVEPGTFKEVVRIRSNGAGCTATVVGPRVIATAAHCARTGAEATFEVDGTEYTATITRSSLYPGKDHDIALGVTTKQITGVEYASIGGTATKGLGLTLLGYGCTQPGGSGGNDGVLRIGESAIVDFSDYDMVSKKPGGAALCYGDSGGPAFVIDNGKHLLLGINSKGNIQDTNYNTRTDISESKSFVQGFAQNQGVKICGVNDDCSGSQPDKPACSMSANPGVIKVGEQSTISLIATNATSATINGQTIGVPSGSISVLGSAPGTFSAQGSVAGPGGTADCGVTYIVQQGPPPPDDKPTCELTAVPSKIKLGESLKIQILTDGKVNSASINGQNVNHPLGTLLVTPGTMGFFSAAGVVSGPGGSNSCSTTYEVSEGDDPIDPSIPNFAMVATHCGVNTVGATPVRTACLGTIKKDSKHSDLKVEHAIQVTFTNGAKELMPVLHAGPKVKQPGSFYSSQEMLAYANSPIHAQNYLVLDTRKQVVTYDGKDPISFTGRTSKGQYFSIDELKPTYTLHP